MRPIRFFFYCISMLCLTALSVHAKTTFNKHQTIIKPHFHTPTVNHQQTRETTQNIQPITEKEWNIFIYIAGNNDLYSFIDENLKQLQALCATNTVNFIVQTDKFGTRDVTRTLIQNNQSLVYWRASEISNAERAAKPRLYNSGAVENFVDFLSSGIERFKAKKQCVVVWNHGSGSIDPTQWRSSRFDMDVDPATRGMAFNNSYNYFLSNTDLTVALSTVCATALNNKPIEILGLDICHGGQIEIAAQAKGCVQYIVASQEVELASGWNYTKAFATASSMPRTPLELATDIVDAYKKEYGAISADYTLAIYDLISCPENQNKTYFELLELALNDLSIKLLELLKSPEKAIIGKVVSEVRKKRNLCCDFYYNEYIDLHLFAMSLQNNLRQLMNLRDFRYNFPATAQKVQEAMQLCVQTIELINKVVPYYTSGIAFSGNPIRARGISIAFPLGRLHSSYQYTVFARSNTWPDLVKACNALR